MANKKQVEQQQQQGFVTRLTRGLVVVFILAAVVLVLGSKVLHGRLLDSIQKRNSASSSMVLGRPIEISRGTNFRSLHLTNRLERLGYQPIKYLPQHAGQYFIDTSSAHLFLRQTILPSGEPQPEALYTLSLKDNVITSIRSIKFNEEVKTIYLEAEPISLIGDKTRRAVNYRPLEDFPPNLVNAVLAIEDERFFTHFGIDPVAILRAVVINLTSGGLRQGGSTLTQQLAKNLFFFPKNARS